MSMDLPRRRALALAAVSLLFAGSNRAFAQAAGGPPRVVLLLSGSRRTEPETIEIFQPAMLQLGYVDKKSMILDVRELENRFDRLPALLQDILRTNPSVIVAAGSQSIRAAHAATRTVPIVAISVGYPVEQGLAKSLSAPGGNVTGNALIQEVSDEKTVDIVKQLVPQAARIAVLINPSNPIGERSRKRYEAATAKLGLACVFLDASTHEELPKTLGKLAEVRADALIVANDAMLNNERKTILDAVARHRIPAIYSHPLYVAEGGLLAYTYDRKRLVQNAASFVDRILKGRQPADLPFEQPTHFVLAINLKTAKAIGIAIPQALLLRADRVIE